MKQDPFRRGRRQCCLQLLIFHRSWCLHSSDLHFWCKYQIQLPRCVSLLTSYIYRRLLFVISPQLWMLDHTHAQFSKRQIEKSRDFLAWTCYQSNNQHLSLHVHWNWSTKLDITLPNLLGENLLGAILQQKSGPNSPLLLAKFPTWNKQKSFIQVRAVRGCLSPWVVEFFYQKSHGPFDGGGSHSRKRRSRNPKFTASWWWQYCWWSRNPAVQNSLAQF